MDLKHYLASPCGFIRRMGLDSWILPILLGGLGTLAAAERNWTDLEGRVIQGDFISVDPAAGKVKLKLKNGTTPSVDLAKLSEGDRTWIAEYQRKEKAALAEQMNNRGKVVSMKSEGPAAVGYHVYYPTGFNPAKPPAMIILFSAGGNGKGILGSVKAACEELGWIGVGCDEFKNRVTDAVLDPKWQEVLPAIEKAVPHNEDLLYLGGMSGGAERCYDYAEVTLRPWKGILALGGWMGGKKALGCPPRIAIARVNGDKDKNARIWEENETPLLKRAGATLKSFSFPGGHEVAPPSVILDAMRWLQATTVPGKRLSSGKRHIAELDRDNGAGK